MTKPSYEELPENRREAFLRGYEAGNRETFDEMKSLASEDDGKISELEAELARVRGLLQRQWISVEERLPQLQELVLLANDGEFELGLRGLDGQEWFWCDADGLISEKFYEFGTEGSTVTHWQPIVPPNFPQSSSLVSQGAESADIGKLDRVDESRCKLLDGSMRVCELGTFACSVIHDMSIDDQFKGMATDEKYQAVTKELLGSAETGGEKA